MIKITDDNSELLKRIAEGNEQAFGSLFYSYSSVVRGFALKFTKSEDIADEIVQEIFLRIWLNRDRLEHVENIKAYLYRYASNACLSHIRKTLRENRHIDNYKLQQDPISNDTINSIALKDVSRLIKIAVDKLPPQRRKIYHLSRVQGKSINEIAEYLGLSANTVKNTLVSALKSIREYLKSNGVALEIIMFFYFFL